MAEHSTLTDPQLHEPKGVAGASAGTVYTATGSGSGNWASPIVGIYHPNTYALNVLIPNISSASSVFVPSPVAGNVTAVYVTLYGALTGSNPVVTGKILGVPIGGLSITCTTSGSAAGSTFSGTPSSAYSVTAGNAIEIDTSGGSTGAYAANVTVVVTATS